MFISRPSDPRTLLLWGDRWWFAGTGASREFTSLAHAAEVLAAHYADEPKPVRLRLIYQPDVFESVAVACPHGDRATLAAALAGEFPALADPDHAWGHEPVLPAGNGFSTLLHFEGQPGLFTLAARLAHLGLAVDSAWPLATFLHALPEEWSETGAVTVVALQAERAVAYRHPADAGRTVQLWHGDTTVAEVGHWLAGIFAQNAEEPVLLFCADDEVAEALGAYAPLDCHPGLDRLPLVDALARPVVLPRYHPAQLLPRLPVVTAQRAVIAASLAFLLFAGWIGAGYARESMAARAETDQRQARLAALRAEVGHLRENATEIATLRAALDSGSAGPPCGAFLAKVSTTLPPGIVITSLRTSGRNLTLDGWLAPTAPATLIEDWRSRLAPVDAPWTVAARSGHGGAFTLTGVFRP
ncbi:MAG: hypothetical protein EXS33_00195 [Pedosphaera sp.]|nr:hypothetical protein [Pedosphaera sp.]